MLIFAAAASTTSTVQVNYVPQFIYFVASSAPSRITITPLGSSPIVDLDASGVACMANMRNQGTITNGYLLPVANGQIKNRVTEIIFTNTVAGVVNVYDIGMEEGTGYIQTIGQTILAGNTVEFVDFHAIGIPSAASGDVFDITWVGGLTHRFVRDELLAMIAMTQVGTSQYLVDNWEHKIRKILITPAATQKVYVTRTVPAGIPAGGIK
jgi:hypothetical protein